MRTRASDVNTGLSRGNAWQGLGRELDGAVDVCDAVRVAKCVFGDTPKKFVSVSLVLVLCVGAEGAKKFVTENAVSGEAENFHNYLDW